MRSHDIEGGYAGEPREAKPPRLSADKSPAPPTDEHTERPAVEQDAGDKPTGDQK